MKINLNLADEVVLVLESEIKNIEEWLLNIIDTKYRAVSTQIIKSALSGNLNDDNEEILTPDDINELKNNVGFVASLNDIPADKLSVTAKKFKVTKAKDKGKRKK